jgi:elongation factor Ts
MNFVGEVATVALDNRPDSLEALLELPIDAGQSVEDKRKALVSKIGENIQVRRFELMDAGAGTFGSYLHGTRIGVLLSVENGKDELIKDIAMHIAASRPTCVTEDQVPAELLDKEREILIAQAQDSGKPQDIIEKMVDGRIRKYLAEITLVGQPFVKDPDKSVGALLKDEGANVTGFVRFEVGEGIEKKQENFADEVMAQVNAS